MCGTGIRAERGARRNQSRATGLPKLNLAHPFRFRMVTVCLVAAIRSIKPTMRDTRASMMARWIRIVMTQSSGVPAQPTDDVRDRLGFVMKELSAGVLDSRGHFHDRMHHGKSLKEQTIIYVSSTDPWHSQSDLDEGVEQVGWDRIYSTGLTNNLPMLVPTGLLYDTPENAANEIRYLRARGYKV